MALAMPFMMAGLAVSNICESRFLVMVFVHTLLYSLLSKAFPNCARIGHLAIASLYLTRAATLHLMMTFGSCHFRARSDTRKFNVNHYPLGGMTQCIWFGNQEKNKALTKEYMSNISVCLTSWLNAMMHTSANMPWTCDFLNVILFFSLKISLDSSTRSTAHFTINCIL